MPEASQRARDPRHNAPGSRRANKETSAEHDPSPKTDHHGTAAGGGDALTTNSPDGRPEPERANVDKADGSGTLTVIVQPQGFRLPNVLRHIEAGKIVLVIPQHNGPD